MTDIDALIAETEEWIKIAEEDGKQFLAQTYRVLLDALTAERAKLEASCARAALAAHTEARGKDGVQHDPTPTDRR